MAFHSVEWRKTLAFILERENFVVKTSESFSTDCRDATDATGDNRYFEKPFNTQTGSNQTKATNTNRNHVVPVIHHKYIEFFLSIWYRYTSLKLNS